VRNIPRAEGGTAGQRGDVQPFQATDRPASDIPWQRYQSYRLDDATVAKVNVSTGNLMIATTDLDIAGVGQRLRANHTYNSFWTGNKGALGLQLPGLDRDLDEWTGSVTIQGESGDTMTFPKKTGGGFDPAKGYKADLTKDTTGVYTLTWREDGRKETFTAAAGLTSITERNGGTITVSRPTGTVLRATDTRSGRWLELRSALAGPDTGGGPDWQDYELVDNTGRATTYHVAKSVPGTWSPTLHLTAVEDVDGDTTSYDYDADDRVTRITTGTGHVTRFTYDADDRVTSVTQVTDLPTGQEAATLYAYSAGWYEPGTNTITDPRGNATVLTVQADGKVDRVTDAQGHKRDTTYDANNNVQTAGTPWAPAALPEIPPPTAGTPPATSPRCRCPPAPPRR